ncbi:hypothetical protein O7606_03730 [Micromonospora sp. WMMD882]|uniref:hypothetical protein n=1 Tax=Micromonospora sp. WMMD882 TaxID=3015151 RepID=UPI00248CE5D9|nr:hypothetical protein [Micromonospora sp. WMMD882]WBB80507.1 hypothetical protein O7606_03730 [Micromonospora sp. WMMD882]
MSMRGWWAGTGLAALTLTAGACAASSPDATGPSATTTQPATTSAPASSATGSTPTGSPQATPTGPTGGPSSTSTGSAPPVLSGDRQVTIVRVDAFESGLSMTDEGRLAEVDDDRGRQLFVPTPQAGGKFLIKAYQRAGGRPVCWQVVNPGGGGPLSVRAATCAEDDPRQQFDIAPAAGDAERTYVISNSSAFLRNSARDGLILEELGDAPPTDAFRLVDNGPAPA